MILTVEQARAGGVSSTLDDSALLLLLESAESAITEAAGPLLSNAEHPVTERHRPHGPLLMLGRRAITVDLVSEGITELDPDDYRLRTSGTIVDRLDTGTNPSIRWRHEVAVTYTPYSTFAERARVQLELVRLDITFNPGISSQSIGPWSESYSGGKAYVEQRSDILASLSGSFVGIL